MAETNSAIAEIGIQEVTLVLPAPQRHALEQNTS
jgi:hypothetical protein